MSSGVAARKADPQPTVVTEPRKLRLVENVAVPQHSRVEGWSRRIADWAFGAASLVPTAPLLDIRDFRWTRTLRERWQEIRREGLGGDLAVASEHCPVTAAAVDAIPGLYAARFQRLASGAHMMPRILAERALLTCHLGLSVPRGGDLRIQLGDRVARWAEGETLLFDGSQAQGWFNDGAESGLILTVQVRRPLHRPARWTADALLQRR